MSVIIIIIIIIHILVFAQLTNISVANGNFLYIRHRS